MSDFVPDPVEFLSAAADDLLPRARAFVLRHGHNPSAYQTLNPGFRYFFSPTRDSVVAYARRGRMWVAAGPPICPPEDLPHCTAEFERAAAADHHCSVCYSCAADRLHTIFAASPNHSIVKLGADPVWDPCTWPDLVKRQRSIRSQINRGRNKHVTAAERPAIAARSDPALRRVLAEWLATKNLPHMHFLNPADPAAGPLDDRLLFTASHDGQPVAFLLASPVPGRNGHLVEQLARSPRAPNGTAELLIDHAFRALAARGHTYATLGLVLLSTHTSYHDNPRWLRFLMRGARAYGRRFYNFNGLESFRNKLHPERWEPRYAIANSSAFPPAALYAIAGAMFGASPIRVLSRALTTALCQELSTFFGF